MRRALSESATACAVSNDAICDQQRMLTYEPNDRVKPTEALAHPFLHGSDPRIVATDVLHTVPTSNALEWKLLCAGLSPRQPQLAQPQQQQPPIGDEEAGAGPMSD